MAYDGVESTPLLPSVLKDRLAGGLRRVLGYVVLVGWTACAVSLLTWSHADPSLTHATSGATRNLLGPLGAIFSDLLLQVVGLAAPFLLLAPLFWALQLIGRQPVAGWRAKVIFAPIAVLCIASALSALPAPQVWPLYHHGLGGMFGDVGLSLLAGVLARINPERAFAAAGLFYLAGGLIILMRCVGFTQQDLKLIMQRGPRPRLSDLVTGTRWYKGVCETVSRSVPAGGRREPILRLPPDLERTLRDGWSGWRATGRAYFHTPRPRAAATHRDPEPELTYDPAEDREAREMALRLAPERPAGQAQADDFLADADEPLGPEREPDRHGADRWARAGTAAHEDPYERGGWDPDEELYDRAVEIVLHEKRASAPFLQRRLAIPHRMAADLIERMERSGIVGLPAYNGHRPVLAG